MTRIEIERLLVKSVAEALGVELPKPRRTGKLSAHRVQPAGSRRHDEHHAHA